MNYDNPNLKSADGQPLGGASEVSSELPSDLAPIAAALDSIGHRAGASRAGLAERVFGVSRLSLGAGDAAPVVKSLADDRVELEASAAVDLEENAFQASREPLARGAPALRLVGGEQTAARPVIGSMMQRAFRLAAVFTLCGGVLAIYSLTNRPATPVVPVPTIADAAANDAAVIEALDTLGDALAFDQLDALMAEATSLEHSFENGLVIDDEFFEKGAL